MSNTPLTVPDTAPWYKQLSRYHWFVFIVCALGWGFDTFDQQLFAIVRTRALADVMGLDPTDPVVTSKATFATSLMLIGWATGGIFFGIMGDKIGRAKTMIFTILTYAVFTGMSGLAQSSFDFLLYRFLTGLGIGGQFAAGVTLLSETMPDKARPKTLGMLQIVGALGNMSAASLQMLCGVLATYGIFGDIPTWRILFWIGFLPALLAIVVFRYLDEPQKWKDAMAAGGVKKAGNITDLFTDPKWRYNVIIGMMLATCGVIGLWGIGFFSIDLTRITLQNKMNQEFRTNGGNTVDFKLVHAVVAEPSLLATVKEKKLNPLFLIGTGPKQNEPAAVLGAMVVLAKEMTEPSQFAQITTAKIASQLESYQDKNGKPYSSEFIAACKEKFPIMAAATLPSSNSPDSSPSQPETEPTTESATEPYSVETVVATDTVDGGTETADSVPATTVVAAGTAPDITGWADTIVARNKKVSGDVGFWAGIASLFFNFGAVIGTYVFTLGAERFGRRPTFTMAFIASLAATLMVFLTMKEAWQVMPMQFILGFCTLSIFGGYAIYFPELFPTRMRSTAISFCYNIGRFAAATGPLGLGLLTTHVFADAPEPIRYAGAAMSVTFIFGIIVTWLGPETKGKPLPE